MTRISASIVLYNSDLLDATKAIKSFLNTSLEARIFLIDNSETRSLSSLCGLDSRIDYIFNNKNMGFGSAHNIAIKKSIRDDFKYHLILNPDVYFHKGVLEQLISYMDSNEKAGLIMPKVLYPDGQLQYLCKLLPTPFDFFLRRLIPIKRLRKYISYNYELRNFDYNHIANIPVLSGCFMFTRNSIYSKIGMFDETFFLHVEDIDFCRRVHQEYETIYYPTVHIFHEHQGISKNLKVLKLGIKSGIYYFNKWGWFFDDNRGQINNDCISELPYKE